MNKTSLIFRHEFLSAVRRTGFIVMTLIIPVIALLAIGVFRLVSEITTPSIPEEVTIGYIDEIGGFDRHTDQGQIKLVCYDTTTDAKQALIIRDISEYIVIPPDYLSAGLVNRFTLEKQLETPAATTAAIKRFLTSNILEGKIPHSTVNIVESPLRLTVTRLTETGEIATDQGGFGNFIIPGIFSFLLAFSLNFCANYFLQGLGEEKESRLIEVLLSSVSTRQLLIGKVLGLGAAGMVQVLIWLISAPFLLHLASVTFGGFFSDIQLPGNFVILGIVYFILGYLLFAVLSAGVGAITPNAREGQQMALIYTLFAFVPLWFSSLLFVFPNNPFYTFLTIFPITSPVAIMLKMGVTGIAAWQLAASIGVLVISIIMILFLAIKAFRIYLLMYGKRPGLGEIFRNLRSS